VTLSIVIVNYRSWDKLAHSLASLRPLVAGEAMATEIIVVDNVSGDGRLAEFAEAHPEARFVSNDGNWGFADGCNRGAREARGEFLLFFNPDAEDPGGGIDGLVAVARSHPDVAILTARQVDERGRAQKVFDVFPSLFTLFGPARAVRRLAAPGRYPDPRRDRTDVLEVDWVSGSALFTRKSVFDALGGFCNGFWMYSEDVDLCRRARDAGHKVAVAGSITLRHAHGGASRKDADTSALTRSEVVVSRHFYASRHLGPWHALAYHLALAATRFMPAVLAMAADAIGLGTIRAVRVRARMGRHLARYYRRVPTRGWRSLRARE
jgi:GT2 family glycosyltransferase